MRINELLNASVSPDEGACGLTSYITVHEHNTESTGACILSFSDNKVFDLLR